MKFLILILCIFCLNATAENWHVIGSKKTFMRKPDCVSSKQIGQVCVEISGKDMRRFKLGQVDDLDSPKHTKADAEPCSDFDSCQPLFVALDCSVHPDGSFRVMLDDFSEVYCAIPNGFNQKDGLVIDVIGSIAADVADAQLASDNALRATKAGERVTGAAVCVIAVNSGGVLTNPEIQNCLNVLVKQLFESKISPSDL